MKKRIYNQTALFGPVYAYLVVLSPPDTIRAAIAKIKRDLDQIADIGERNSHSIAHITLFDKLTDDIDIPGTVAELVRSKKSFTVKVNGWGFFDHGKNVTVYLAIEDPAQITDLVSSLKISSKSPHISLAKKIPYDTFEKLLPYLERLDYSAEWVCDEINVLRKLMSEKHLGFRESFKIALKA
jgi:2'-5' RNA ligase